MTLAPTTTTTDEYAPKILTSYQIKVVTSPWFEPLPSGREIGRKETFEKARRVGGSVAAAFRAVLWAAGFELKPDGTAVKRPPMDVIVVSKDFPSSKKLLEECRDAFEDFKRIGPQFDYDAKATTIKCLSSGRQIIALPCSAKRIRGNTAAVIADEFAFWRQMEDCWAAVKSVTDPNLKLPTGMPALMVTTPWDAGSLAHRIFTDPSFPFHRHHVDIDEAIAAGFPIDKAHAFAELGIPEFIQTEYLCMWMHGGLTFFPADKLRDACRDVEDLPPGYETAPVIYGIDVGGGRGRDFTACVQWRVIDDERWMMGVKAFNDLDIEQQVDALARWIRQAPGQVRIDRGVMGLDLISMLKNRLAGNKNIRITGVGMTPADQEKFAVNAKRMFEHDQVRFFTGTDFGGDENGHTALILEMSQLKTKPGVGGRLSFQTPREQGKGHLDRAWGALIGAAGRATVSANGASIGGYRPTVNTIDFDRDTKIM